MDERKTIPQRMDDMVRWTGIPALTEARPRRRPLRWLSTLVAFAAIGGFVAGAAVGFAGRASWIGYGVVFASLVAGSLLQIFGPIKPFNSGERVDEFDAAMRARAYLFTFPVFATATALGLLTLMYLLLQEQLRPAALFCVANLLMMLVALATSVPIAYASWAVEWDKDEG